MCMVKGRGHIFSPVSNWLAFFVFHINQINNSWVTAILKFDLAKSRVNSWMRAKLTDTQFIQYSTGTLPFHFTSSGPTIPELWPVVFDFENNAFIFIHSQKNICIRFSPISNQVISMTRQIKLPSVVVIGWLDQTCRQANVVHQCHRHGLWSRSWKSHPAYYSRLFLSQLSKFQHKWCWSEMQKSLKRQWQQQSQQWMLQRKWTENINSLQTGVT